MKTYFLRWRLTADTRKRTILEELARARFAAYNHCAARNEGSMRRRSDGERPLLLTSPEDCLAYLRATHPRFGEGGDMVKAMGSQVVLTRSVLEEVMEAGAWDYGSAVRCHLQERGASATDLNRIRLNFPGRSSRRSGKHSFRLRNNGARSAIVVDRGGLKVPEIGTFVGPVKKGKLGELLTRKKAVHLTKVTFDLDRVAGEWIVTLAIELPSPSNA